MLKLKYVQLECIIGKTLERFSASTARSLANDVLSLDISTSGDIFEASVTSRETVRLVKLSAVFERKYSGAERIFLNGYQSCTDSYEHTIGDRMHGISHIPAAVTGRYAFDRSGDYRFVRYGNSQGQLHGFSYGYIRSGESCTFMGSLSEDNGFTVIYTDTAREEVAFVKDCRGLTLKGSYSGLRLYLAESTEQEAFDEYFRRLGVKLRPEAAPFTGYYSRQGSHGGISETAVLSELERMKPQSFRTDVFCIDGSYETAVGDWLSPDRERFPLGLKPVADRIMEEGYIPGLRISPFVCSENSSIWQDHRHWAAKDSDGNWIKTGTEQGGCYALDIMNKDFREYLREVFDTIVNKWGFRFLKLDSLYAACIQPKHTMTRGMLMAEAMGLIREIAGDAFILAGDVPLASAFGRADYCRTGCDVSPEWDGKPYMRLTSRERISTRSSMLSTVFRRQLNGRAFLCAPDVFMLGSEYRALDARQKQCLGEVNAAACGLLLTADDTEGYTAEQKNMLSEICSMTDAMIVSAGLYGDVLRIEYSVDGRLIQRDYKV